MKIAFRVDSSLVIGSGHVMRCLTLAHALVKEVNAEVLFCCRSFKGNAINIIESNGFNVILMKANEAPIKQDKTYQTWLGAAQAVDAEEFIAAAHQYNINFFDLIITDHYGISAKWEKEVRKIAGGITVIDDLANREHICDFIIDQNYYKNFSTRYNHLVNADCHKLLGPNYTLLRNEFSVIKDNLPSFEKRLSQKIITLFFGGTDPDNYSEKALNGLLSVLDNRYQINVILGAANPNLDKFKAYEKKFKQVTCYIQVDNMSEHIGQSLLFVGAIGATTWERCCCGTPGLVTSVAENQIQAAIDLHDISAHFYLGNAESVNDEDYGKAALQLLNNEKLLQQQHLTSMKLVNASGAKVVANHISHAMLHQSYIKEI